MNRLVMRLVLAAIPVLPATVGTAAITGIFISYNSSPDSLIEQTARVQEFRKLGSAPTGGTRAGDTASFDSRFGWMLAHRVQPGGPAVAPLHTGLVAYDPSFRVEDPLAQGCSLEIDSLMRGYIGAPREPTAAPGYRRCSRPER